MTFQEREAERLEALRRFEETKLQKESSKKCLAGNQTTIQAPAAFLMRLAQASPAGTLTKDIALSKSQDAATNSVLAKRWPNPIEVWADNSVYDAVAGTFLQPGRDFLIGELQRR